MFELLFETTGQAVFYRVEPKDKRLEIKSIKTNYEWVIKPWEYLFDEGIYWAKPLKKYNTNLKMIPLKIRDLKKNPILRKMHGLNRKEVKEIQTKNEQNVKEEMKLAEKLTEDELKKVIIYHMESIGYRYVKKENANAEHT